MSKTAKTSIMVILILVVLFAIVWLVYDHFKQEPVDANVIDSDLEDGNTGLDNIINELFENEDVVNKTVEKKEPEDKANVKPSNNANQSKNESKDSETITETVTSREEKAIELVKETWGDTKGIIVTCASIDNEGRYIVSVNDANTSRNLAWFTVDVDKKTVEKQ